MTIIKNGKYCQDYGYCVIGYDGRQELPIPDPHGPSGWIQK